jgi:ABC-type cobalamin/Fe3+-siderophores transport system ATPase subunit
MNQRKTTTAPCSIISLEVKRLFGRYSYLLPREKLKSNSLSSLIILYGDNGSGKTTLLKLLFYLLSSKSENLRFLAQIPLARFSVSFADGKNLTIARQGNNLVGSFQLTFQQGISVIAQADIKADEGNNVSSTQSQLFYKKLSTFPLNLFLVRDDRLESDIFNENSDNLVPKEYFLKTSIQRFDNWIRQQALKGVNQSTVLVDTLNHFFIDKQVQFSDRDGLTITTTEREHQKLSIDMLSSGEKQLILLFCNTLTTRDKSTLFIIDEPEISLNIKWQRQLLRVLLDLTKGSQVQFVMATHSIELLSQYRSHVLKLSNVEGN